jgi:hypothetical protein
MVLSSNFTFLYTVQRKKITNKIVSFHVSNIYIYYFNLPYPHLGMRKPCGPLHIPFNLEFCITDTKNIHDQ